MDIILINAVIIEQRLPPFARAFRLLRHIMANRVRTRKTFICRCKKERKRRDSKIRSTATDLFSFYRCLFVIALPPNQRTRRDFAVHACHSIRNNDGDNWDWKSPAGTGVGSADLETHVERGERDGTRGMGKVGLRTREPSIMHVPRSRCD